MGLLDFFETKKTATTFTPKNEFEAWIAIMYAFMATDGEVDDSEIENLTRSVVPIVRFKDYDFVQAYKKAMDAHWKDKISLVTIIEASCPLIQKEYRDSLFSNVLDMIGVGGITAEEEQNLMMLSKKLNVEESVVQQIFAVYKIRVKGRNMTM